MARRPKRRILRLGHLVAERKGQFLAPHIEGADSHHPSGHAGDDLRQGFILGVFVGEVLPVHEEELGPQQAHTLGPGGQRMVDLARKFQVRLEDHLLLVRRLRRNLAQPVQGPGLPLQLLAERPVIGQPFSGGMDDDPAVRAIDDDRVAVLNVAYQIRHAEHRGKTQRPGHDGGMALRPAQGGRETGDPRRVHQRGVGRRDLLGDDDAVGVQRFEACQIALGQPAHDPIADLSYVLRSRAQIGIVHFGEILGDRCDLGHDRRLGVTPILGDAGFDAADKTRGLQHLPVRIEQIAQLLGRRAVERKGLRLQLSNLTNGARHGLMKPLALLFETIFRHAVLGNVEITRFPQMGPTDGNTGRDTQPFEYLLSSFRLCVHVIPRGSDPSQAVPRRRRRPWPLSLGPAPPTRTPGPPPASSKP